MKKTLLLLYIVLSVFSIQAQSLFSSMMEVNEQWQYHLDGIAKIKSISSLPSEDLIQSHLLLVHQILSERNVAHLTIEQKNQRKILLDELYQYALAGVVPINDYAKGRFPIFIDRKGTHCAVGFLMKQSGFAQLAQEIDATQKFAKVKEITHPQLLAWQEWSGFTVDELAWIQPAYAYATSELLIKFDEGLDGVVNKLSFYEGEFSVLAAGKFHIVNGDSNVLLAGWNDEFWVPLIKGDGIIHQMEVRDEEIFCYGHRIYHNYVFKGAPMPTYGLNSAVKVIYEEGEWRTYNSGIFDAEITFTQVYNGKRYAGGNFTGLLVWDDDFLDFHWRKIEVDIENVTAMNTVQHNSDDWMMIGNYDTLNRVGKVYSFDGNHLHHHQTIPSKAPTLFKRFKNSNILMGVKNYHYKPMSDLDSSDYILGGYLYMTGKPDNNPSVRVDFAQIPFIIDPKYTFLFSSYCNHLVDFRETETGCFLWGEMTNKNLMYYGENLLFYDYEKEWALYVVSFERGIVRSVIFKNDSNFIAGGAFNLIPYREPPYYNRYSFLHSPGIVEYKKRPPLREEEEDDIPPAADIEVIAWPNPVTHIIHVKETSLLYDSRGNEIKTLEKGENDVRELPLGIYFVKQGNQMLKILKN